MINSNTINQALSLSSVVRTLQTSSKELGAIYSTSTSEKYGIITVANTDINTVVRIIMPYCFASPKPRRLSSNKIYLHYGTTVMSIFSEHVPLAPDTLEVICRALIVANSALAQLPTLRSIRTPTDLDIRQRIFNTLITSCEDIDKNLTVEVSIELVAHQFLWLMANSHPCLYGRHIRVPYYPSAPALAASIAIYVVDCTLSHLSWLQSLQAKKTCQQQQKILNYCGYYR